jgi:hypothetical protein
MELEYDKALLALHPLGITVTAGLYNQMTAAKLKIHSEWSLYLSWSAWILGLVATLLSFQTSVHANREALDRHDAGEHSETNYKFGLVNAADRKAELDQWYTSGRWCNFGSFVPI